MLGDFLLLLHDLSLHFFFSLSSTLTFDFCLGSPKKHIIWDRRKQTGLRNHGRLLLIVPGITGVEATPLQVREAMSSTPTMITMNPLRKTCGHKMNTATNAIPLPSHPENTDIM